MANTVKNPYDMDSTTFDAEKYLEKLLKDCTLKQIMDTEAAVVKDTQTLHSDMQTLVYENYNKFISATDTIRKMKNDFKQMETDMDLLKDKMNTITTFSEQITGTLQGTRSRLCRLSEKHSLLKRLQFLSSLPGKLKALIEEQNYVQAVQDYKHAQKVFEQYGFQPSFEGIRKDCDVIMTDLKQYLRQEFQRAGKTAQSLTEIGELLLQLDEKAPDMATEMLNCASKRLHEQVVMLQDQTERDMIEFVDMGIEGLLNDLTLVVTSYFDMFVAKHYENERDDFQEHALKELNVFLNVNIDKYLTLVQDRVESDVGFGNTQVMLRALDRLHRRLLAMRNICRGIEIQRNTVDIIISAAHQLCDTHSKNLKDHFSDSLSSVRISLVSSKSDSVSGANLNDLITNLYVSLVEKVRGVLQDLLVFLQTDWSFNIKSDHKGTLCMEGIRENLLIGFLRHISKVISSFGDTSTSSPPNLLLVLSKTCLEMEQNGVHILISLADDLYEIDSENSAILTHETEICAEMRETAQSLLDTFVRLQGFNISQMLRKSVETRDWLNCLEPRTVRAVMKRVVDELSSIETVVASLYDYPPTMRTTASSDSSRKTHFSNLTNSKQQFRSNWSNYTPSQLESSYVSNIHRLFSERIDIFTSVEFSKVSIITGIIKIGLKTLLESVRLRTFSKFGLQQIQVDTHYLQMNLWRFVKDENLINFLLDEILGSAVHRCLESTLMEPNAVEIICERVIFLRVHYKSIKLAEKKMQMALCQSSVLKVYHAVIEDVIANVRDAFLDEGVDEQVLQEMKQIWRTKLMASKAVEIKPDPPETQPPLIVANNPKAQVAKAKKAAAAAAAASQHQQQQQNNNNGAAQSASSNCSSSSVTADVKPNIVNLQQLSNVPSTTAGTSTVTNTTINGTIKQEPQQQQQQSQPPPLHPTSSNSAIILQQQKQQQQQQVGGSNQQQQPAASSSNNQPQSSTIAILATLDPNRIMPVNITLPAQLGTMNSESRVLTIHVPASALQENQLTQILTAHLISSIMSLPTTLASSVLQQHVNAALVNANMQKNFNTSKQLDGAVDTSDEDESEESDGNMDDDDNDDLDKEDESDVENEGGAEEEPLNSEDDVTDEDASDLFDTDNVIVCQYDKITRSRNKWKFYLKDGIMNIGGKDYVFQKSNGDAEW